MRVTAVDGRKVTLFVCAVTPGKHWVLHPVDSVHFGERQVPGTWQGAARAEWCYPLAKTRGREQFPLIC
jgi:hypothetical protein